MEAKRLSYKEADLFQYYLEELPQVTKQLYMNVPQMQ